MLFFVGEIWLVVIPKSTVLVIIFRFFIWLFSFINAGGEYPYAEIRNFTAGRRTRSFQKENDNNGTSLSSSNDEFTPKYKKSYGLNINANFNAIMERRCEELIEADNVLFPKFLY